MKQTVNNTNYYYHKDKVYERDSNEFFFTSFKRIGVTLLLITFLTTSISAQVLEIKPDTEKHRWYGLGMGFALYHGHMLSLSSSNYDLACDWLFSELNVEYIRTSAQEIGEIVNDDSNPYTQNWSAFDLTYSRVSSVSELVREARSRGANAKVMLLCQNYPDFLKVFDSNGNITALNYSYPNFYAELAEWIYVHLVQFKTVEGLDVDAVELLNEPDLKSWIDKTDGNNLISNVTPILQSMINGNPYGVKMPLFMGPTNTDMGSAVNWCDDLSTKTAWNYLDAFTCHNYGSHNDLDKYQHIKDKLGNKLFLQNEMHVRGADNFAAALSLGHTMAIAIHGGVNTYHYFQGNYPSYHLGGLLITPWAGTPQRNEWYWTFKHFSDMPRNSWVIGRERTNIPGDVYTVAFKDGNTIWVHFINEGTTSKNTAIQIRNRAINRVRDYQTKEDNGDTFTLINDDSYSGASEVKYWIGPKQIRTFRIDVSNSSGRTAELVSNDTNTLTEGIKRAYPNPFIDATTFEFTIPEKSEVKLQVFNNAGQLINVLIDATINAGDHVINWGIDNKSTVKSGIYHARLTVDGKVYTKKLIVQ